MSKGQSEVAATSRQVPEVRIKIPPLIRRNTILLALSQAFVGASNQMLPSLGALMAVYLTHSNAFAGLATSITGVSRFLVAYPLGRVMDTYGRKAGIVLGLGLGLVGTLLTATAIIFSSFAVFVVAMLIFGMSINAGHQLRVAAADMYPPSRRAEGLGYVLTGSLIGALGGPLIISLAEYLSPGLGLNRLATPWLLAPGVIFFSMVLVTRIQPDPRDIAVHLDRYYPGYQPHAVAGVAANVPTPPLLRHYPRLVAVVFSFAAQGTMVMIMAMTAFVLDYHGHQLPAISLAVAIHVAGMYAFSLPLGRLCDMVGRCRMLFVGAAIEAAGALFIPVASYWAIVSGTFLVGLGWSCINIASTAMIADTTRPSERGAAVGLNDTLSNLSAISLPLLAGPMVEFLGLPSLGILGLVLMTIPLAFLFRLRELTPGQYLDPV